MQIVIDISEEDYKVLKKRYELDNLFLNYYEKLIVHGTLLPKGHGRLIDADALNISHGVFLPAVKGNVLGCPMDAVFAYEIDDAPTIIEADKEDK